MDLNQVTLPSQDVLKAVEFYEKLGLKLIVDARPRYVRFEMPEGDSTLSIHRVDSFSTFGISVYFECSNLDARVTDLQNAGFNFDLEPTDQRWLWREAHLSDPDGNRIILYNAGENRKNPPWRLKDE